MSETKTAAYPQMPAMTNEEVKNLLKQPLTARLATHNADGTIQLSALWHGYDDNGDILLGTQAVTRKVKNIELNPTVSVLVDDPQPPMKGVLIYGQAELEYGDVIEKRTRIFANYVPLEQARQWAEGFAQSWESVIIRVKPTRIISYDYAKGSH